MTAKRHFTFFNARMTSTLSVSLVLFILGIMVLMGLLASNLSTHVKENIGFSIILKESAKDSQIQQFQKILNKAPYVKASQFISKEDALKEVMIELGENPEDILGANPLQSSIEVRLKAEYARNDSISWIEKGLRSNQAVSDITYQKDLIQSVNDNIKKIGLILSVLALVLMVISFALISNTIRLSAYSKRFIIHTMKLVGATPGFIRKPFIVSNIANGVIAAFIAILLLSGCIYYLTNEIDNFYTLVNVELLATVYIIVLLLGIVLTAVSAYFSVNRYIHMDQDDLYYV